jgi:cysteine desulfurase
MGKLAKQEIENANEKSLNLLKKYTHISDNMECIYTSGSSESNNLAIKGIARSYRENGKHIITTFLEHSSVSSPLTNLKEQGYEIDLLEINEDGKINLENLKELLREDTILVSVCYVDSELGTVQPIEEIANILKDFPNCFLHVDCTQALGKININLENVDLASFAPHKFYGLNGFGGLLKRKDIVLEPLIHGGSSTTIYRSGTPVVRTNCSNGKGFRVSFKKFR